MARILVLYYSSWGHMEKMAKAAVEGARAAGADVTVKRAPELVPDQTAKEAHYKLDQDAPVLDDPLELADYDGIIFGAPTRYGMMSAQLKNVLDQTGPLWAQGELVGKVGSVMSSSATQHGGQESTILSFHTVLLHQGMVIVGLPYAFQQQMGLDEIKGGSPYGASTITGGDGSRPPSETELAAARYQGGRVAEVAAKLAA